MNASKENGRKALQNLQIICNCMETEDRTAVSAELLGVEKFLEAAIRKLPSEQAFAKDKKRKVKA